VEQKKNVGRREQLYIDGLAQYLQSTGDNKTRRQTYLKTLDDICLEFPDDLEAKAFLVVRTWQFKGDVPIPSYQAVDALLDQIFAANPMHPAHHYRIHLWDGVRQQRAVGSAAKNGVSSPSIAHQWHMAGHTYSGLSRYAEAAWEQEASSRVDHGHMIHDRVLPDQIHNYAHNQEWLIRDLSHIGRGRDALELAKNMIELPRHPKYNTPAKGSGSYGRTRLYEILERYEMWDDVLALAGTPYLEPTDAADQQIRRLRLIGLAQAGKGNREQLQKVIGELEARTGKKPELAPEPKEGDKPKEDKKEAAPVKEVKKEDKEVKKEEPAKEKKEDKKEAVKGKQAPKGAKTNQPLEETLNELKSSDLLLGGDPKAALDLAQKVKSMSKARLARFYLQAGDKNKAVELTKQAADQAKNQVVPLAQHVEMLHLAGKTKEAGEAFNRLRAVSGHFDSLELPAFKRLEPVAKDMNLPADWRQPVVWPKDRGERPAIESLGPLRWHPSPAASWSLPTAANRNISLSDYRGKPVIVIFYLGAGCVHCIEQLNAFAPKAREFADAGIQLVAISTDSIDDLKKSQAKCKDGSEFPFPLVADSKLEIFKAYRVFDDFEKVPLHGTFLIDPSGLVRWQDISYEPFSDANFLLKESKRLLAIPARAAK
jgi:peroxiredoxin